MKYLRKIKNSHLANLHLCYKILLFIRGNMNLAAVYDNSIRVLAIIILATLLVLFLYFCFTTTVIDNKKQISYSF